MQHNPVCVVLDINLNLYRAFKTKGGEVRVEQEMIVKRNNVPVQQKGQSRINKDKKMLPFQLHSRFSSFFPSFHLCTLGKKDFERYLGRRRRLHGKDRPLVATLDWTPVSSAG